eukprot:11370320-Alexandrium_andersonii.AAC.1
MASPTQARRRGPLASPAARARRRWPSDGGSARLEGATYPIAEAKRRPSSGPTQSMCTPSASPT